MTTDEPTDAEVNEAIDALAQKAATSAVPPSTSLDREALIEDIEAIRRMVGSWTIYDNRPTYEVGDVLDQLLALLRPAPAPEETGR